MAYAFTESTEKTEDTEIRPQTGIFYPKKHKKTAFLRSFLITAIVIAIAY